MVSHGNHPLNQSHYDEETLHDYALGQLLPDEEQQIRQHMDACPLCRAAVTDVRSLTQQLSLDLHKTLDRAEPGPQLSFDKIASEFRKPPRRVTVTFRLLQLAPGASLALLLVLFVSAILVLFPSDDAAALRNLELVDDYNGPPAVIAASTSNGLVILYLSADHTDVLGHLPDVISPRDLLFSSDGRWLAFQQGRTLHVMEARSNGSAIRFTVRDSAEWSWSPDGQMLAYTDGNGQLAVFDTPTQTSHVLVPASEMAWGVPVWTADSRQIAYAVVNPLPADRVSALQQGIWRVTVETGYRVELARSPQPGETILVPAAWDNTASTLLVWDVNAGANGQPPTLYRVNVTAHNLEPIDGYSLAQGMRLAWPVGPQNTLLLARQNKLVALPLDDETAESTLAAQIPQIPQIPWPQSLEWAPNGAWFAYTVAGAAEGQGVYLFALDEGELRPVELPGGASEKAVFWAGAEHLFVIRQPQGTSVSELWMVPLTTNDPSQRVITNMRLPFTGPYNGWRWHDILAAQVITP